jgi:serine/threonine-protein kinase ATR
MARGLRQGDPKLKVVTCATSPGASGKYEKSLSCVKGLEALYDVINLHTYAFAEEYPTWRRSYPEDPAIKYLTPVKETIAWRNANAPGKQIWITEFGWDASTKPAPPTGVFSRWVGSTETQQAEYLVRSFLVFSAMDVDRAYIFFFNDEDEPHVHGSSGLTRKFVPKPAFHAVAHLYGALGDYRFNRVIAQQQGDVYAYEYRHASDSRRRVWAVWSPTGSGRSAEALLPAPHGAVRKAERMPLKEGPAESVRCEALKDGKLRVPVGEAPVYVWLSGAG